MASQDIWEALLSLRNRHICCDPLMVMNSNYSDRFQPFKNESGTVIVRFENGIDFFSVQVQAIAGMTRSADIKDSLLDGRDVLKLEPIRR
ncbi:hypothetical protein BGZ81_007845 [Podila clonocystis]|nr:hypothetical protein BGZ81_007845 [Podila clonocystis]